MPNLNFKGFLVAKILTGEKVHTIRFRGKRRHLPGETLYMQTGSRYRPTLFATHQCLRVREIHVDEHSVSVFNETDLGWVCPPRDLFAQADGFVDWTHFLAFWSLHTMPIEADLIQWAPAQWEGRPIQKKPRYLKTKSYCQVKIPWVTTHGDPSCPHEYNNGVHAAVHSILAGMMCNKIEDVRAWLRTGRRQLSAAIRQLDKPGAAVVPCGQNVGTDARGLPSPSGDVGRPNGGAS